MSVEVEATIATSVCTLLYRVSSSARHLPNNRIKIDSFVQTGCLQRQSEHGYDRGGGVSGWSLARKSSMGWSNGVMCARPMERISDASRIEQ